MRFDFTHFASIERKDLERIEAMVNQKVRQNLKVETKIMQVEEALQTGAMALFGEKYGERVRVVKVSDFSIELCGGTHTSRTGDIGLFKIVNETGVAAGVRRIEALTGEGAYQFVKEEERELQEIAFSPQIDAWRTLLKGGTVASKAEGIGEGDSILSGQIIASRDLRSPSSRQRGEGGEGLIGQGGWEGPKTIEGIC